MIAVTNLSWELYILLNLYSVKDVCVLKDVHATVSEKTIVVVFNNIAMVKMIIKV